MFQATKRCPLMAPLLLLLLAGSTQASLSFGWPSFLGGTSNDVSTVPPTVQPTTTAVPLNIAYQYPIWRVHKYNGIYLKPVDASQLPAQYQVQTTNAGISNPARDSIAVQTNEIDPRQPATQLPAELAAELPAELVEFARSVGITDMSKLPSIEEAMSLLGTSTTDETVAVIKEIAATPDGMDLIRQFLENSEQSSSEEGDISESQNQPSVADVKAEIEAEKEQQNEQRQLSNGPLAAIDGSLDRTHTDLGILGRVVTPVPPQTPAVPSPGFFSSIASFFRPASVAVPLDTITDSPPVAAPLPQLANSNSLLQPFAAVQDADYDRTVQQYYGRPVGQLRESFQASLPTLPSPTIPANLAQPIGQLRDTIQTSFPGLPLPQLPGLAPPQSRTPVTTNAQPIGQHRAPAQPTGSITQAFNTHFPTLALPQIPDHTQVPALPAQFVNLPAVPQLPNIRIPSHAAPTAAQPNPNTPGTYIRVRYPLVGFRPIDARHPVRYQTPTPNRAVVDNSAPAPVMSPSHTQSPSPVRASVSIPQPASIQSPVETPQVPTTTSAIAQTTEQMVFDLPRLDSTEVVRHQFHAADATVDVTAEQVPSAAAADVGKIPLTVANYNVFRNAPRVVSSYGTPALPYTFADEDATPVEQTPTLVEQTPTSAVPVPTTTDASAPAVVQVADEMAAPAETVESADMTATIAEANELVQNEPARRQRRRGRRGPVAQRHPSAQRRSDNDHVETVDDAAAAGLDTISPVRITAFDTVASGRLGRRADEDAIALAIPTQRPAKTEFDVMVRAVNEMTSAAYSPATIVGTSAGAGAEAAPADAVADDTTEA